MDQTPELYNKMQKVLRNGTPILDCDREDIEYIDKPLGHANFTYAKSKKENEYSTRITNGNENNSEDLEYAPKHPKDVIQCELCKSRFRRRNLFIHKKSQKHQIQMRINKKLRDLLT